MIWRKVKLGELCAIEKGNIGITKAIPGDYPLVVLGEERKSHNEYQFDDEAVVIPLVSSTGHGHRSMKRIFYQTGKFAVGSILCAVIPKDKSILSVEFLYRYLDFNKEKELVSRMKGMANVSLPIKEIASVEIPLPSLEEQKQIIEQFQKIETGSKRIISELDHQLELVRQLRQAFLREAMQGKLVAQDAAGEPASVLLQKIKAEKERLIAEKKLKRDKLLPPISPDKAPFLLPNNWAWCRLGEIIEHTENLNIHSELADKTLINYVDIEAIDNQNFCIREVKKKPVFQLSSRARRVLKKGYIVYSLVRPYLNNIAIVQDERENYIGSTGFAVFTGVLVENKFLKFFLLSDYVRKLYLDYMSGFNSPGITYEQFQGTPIPLPPLAEQKRIVAKLETLLGFCDNLETSIRDSKAQAESLLQVALKEALQP